MRFNLLPREASAIIKLRKKGHSINGIALFLGRSYSVIYRILKKNRAYGLHWFDMRKLPYKARMRMSAYRRSALEKLRGAWEQWILGEGEKPP